MARTFSSLEVAWEARLLPKLYARKASHMICLREMNAATRELRVGLLRYIPGMIIYP